MDTKAWELAFQYPRDGTDIWRDTIPPDTDILLTHGPPKYHLDLENFGCAYLLEEIRAKKPLLHVFGHIHAGYGRRTVVWDGFEEAYERAIGPRGSWLDLGKMVVSIFGRRWAGSRQRSVLVNAAAVGGFKDNEQREAVTVTI